MLYHKMIKRVMVMTDPFLQNILLISLFRVIYATLRSCRLKAMLKML